MPRGKRKWLLVAGTVLVVAGIAVKLGGEPALVRYPLNIDQPLTYTGTATIGVNPSTGLPLATPLEVPLRVDRRVKVVRGGYGNAVIDETTAITFAGTTRTETYQYVMDRRNMRLIDSPQAYAFGNPANVMATGDSYRINLPMDTSAHRDYRLWAPQTDSVVTGRPTGPAHHDPVSGVEVVTFTTALDHPVAPYYMKFLEGQGMPASLSGASLAAELRADGVNLPAALQAVASHSTPARAAALATALSRPVPLTYSYFQQGSVSVEPATGAVVGATSTREGISVAPSASATAGVAAALAPYTGLPAVAQLARAAAAIAAPHPVLSMSFTETGASARSAASTARHLADTAALISWQIPVALIALGAVLIVGAVLTMPRPAPRRRTHPARPGRHLPKPA
ncbi:MAG TPA: porin PorA family protein [Acidimicrobiales bacterium]|nr:porin PorA family protein [Acidimicrobiales bacterium]